MLNYFWVKSPGRMRGSYSISLSIVYFLHEKWSAWYPSPKSRVTSILSKMLSTLVFRDFKLSTIVFGDVSVFRSVFCGEVDVLMSGLSSIGWFCVQGEA